MIRPYTVYRNPVNNIYYISSLNGHPNSDNATAHISVMAFKDLETLEVRRFKNSVVISTEYPKTRLHAPKGMLAWRDWLVMCDLDSLAVFKSEEGKKPMSFEVYKLMCRKMITSEADDAIFAHLFLVLEWNLMARSNNYKNMHLSHIEWRNDCLVFFFGKSKASL